MKEIRNATNPSVRRLSRRDLLLWSSAGTVSAVGSFFGIRYFLTPKTQAAAAPGDDGDIEAKFAFLSTHGNSDCSAAFLNSIPSMRDDQRLQGSCCSPMVLARYKQQLQGLKNYSQVAVVPPDPYDIPASLAKQLLEYNKTITPTSTEQAVLDQAVADSNEKGYCCCMCWRWYTYEGLSKALVRNEHYTAQQITGILNNSDGCGGSDS